MNIYFSCSITGGRADQQNYKLIVDHLLESGHTVPTAHLSQLDVFSLENAVSPIDIYLRDMKWIQECNALIAEVSTPSHGVGYEIAEALSLGKPSFCCFQKGKRVSKIITGNTHANIHVVEYEEINGLIREIDKFLRSVN